MMLEAGRNPPYPPLPLAPLRTVPSERAIINVAKFATRLAEKLA